MAIAKGMPDPEAQLLLTISHLDRHYLPIKSTRIPQRTHHACPYCGHTPRMSGRTRGWHSRGRHGRTRRVGCISGLQRGYSGTRRNPTQNNSRPRGRLFFDKHILLTSYLYQFIYLSVKKLFCHLPLLGSHSATQSSVQSGGKRGSGLYN